MKNENEHCFLADLIFSKKKKNTFYSIIFNNIEMNFRYSHETQNVLIINDFDCLK